MSLKCDELSVHKLFKTYSRIKIPKYQRGYAWKKEAVVKFVDDLNECFNSKPSDNLHHFFGGIVAILSKDDSSNEECIEIVDGQQRLTTFVFFVAQLVNNIERYLNEFDANLEEEYKDRLRKFAKGLKYNYLYFRDEFGDEGDEECRLTPTFNDIDCYKKVLENVPMRKSRHNRDSNNNIIESSLILDDFVRGKIVNFKKPAIILKNLEKIKKVLEDDCRLIFITTPDRNYAYRYFQVLNNRGVGLSTGDLLKAETLRLLDDHGCEEEIVEAAEMWDSILTAKPTVTERTFKWIYLARTGKHPSPIIGFADQFLKRIIDVHSLRINSKYGQRMKERIDSVVTDATVIDNLASAQWQPQNVDLDPWKQERLRSLVLHLKQKMAIPLLLALTKCSPKDFYDAIIILERVVCRYINIQKLRPSKLEDMFLRNMKKIYNGKFDREKFRNDLSSLLREVTSDNQFRVNLEEFVYRSNRVDILRVFYSVLENYYEWSCTDIESEPQYEVNIHTSDVNNLVIEHVYPEYQSLHWEDEDLDPVIDNIGNLTVLGASEKNVEDDRSFREKRTMFKHSKFKINGLISDHTNWSFREFESRHKHLIEKAVKIFRP